MLTADRLNPFPELSFDDCFEQVPFEDEENLDDIYDKVFEVDRPTDLERLINTVECLTLEVNALKFQQNDRPYRKNKPVAAVGGIGFLLLCFSAASFAVAGFSSSPSQKDYHAGLAGMLACAGLGTIAAAVATNWDDQ